MNDQAPLGTPMAKLSLKGPAVEMALDGKPKIDLILELEITDTDGDVGTPIQVPVTIRNDAIDSGMPLEHDPTTSSTSDQQCVWRQ